MARIIKHGLALRGRKKLTQKDPRIIPAIEEIISEHTIGDPQDKSKWLSTSAKNIQTCLREKHNINISEKSVSRILKNDLGYSLKANDKNKATKKDHPVIIQSYHPEIIQIGTSNFSISTARKMIL